MIELLAVSCHQIAAYLFNLDDPVHKHRDYEGWIERRRQAEPDEYIAPTSFCHWSYLDADQYPAGIADVVGYWAEAKIFGGVVVFDRGPSGTEASEEHTQTGLNCMLILCSVETFFFTRPV